MSSSGFALQKNSDGTVTKAAVSQGARTNLSPPQASSLSLVNTAGASAFTSVVSGGSPLTLSAASVARLDGPVGVATAGKAIVLDGAKSVSSVGSLKVAAISVNGSAVVAQSGDQGDASVQGNHTNAITPGVAGRSSIVVPASVEPGKADISLGAVELNSLRSNELAVSNKPGSFSMLQHSSLSYGDWRDVSHSPSLQISTMVGSGKLAVVNNSGQLAEYSTSMNFRRVVWLDWLGAWFATLDVGSVSTATPRTPASWVDCGMGNLAATCLLTFRVGSVDWLVVAGTGWAKCTTDLLTWRSFSASFLSGTTPSGIAFGNNTLVFSRTGSLVRVAVTQVGMETPATLPVASSTMAGTWVDVAYSPRAGVFLAINNERTTVARYATSVDGVVWKSPAESLVKSNSGVFHQWLNALGRVWYFPEIQGFVICSDYSQQRNANLYYSYDGVNFYSQACEGDNQIAGICYMKGVSKFFAIPRTWRAGVDNVRDAFHFTPCFTPLSKTPVSMNVANHGAVMAVPGSPMLFTARTHAFMYSSDGQTFYRCKINGGENPANRNIGRVAYSPTLGLYIAGSSNANGTSHTPFIRSTDGANWVDATELNSLSPGVSTLGRDVVFMASVGKFVAFGNNLNVWSSADAVNWTITSSLPDQVGQNYYSGSFSSLVLNDTGTFAVCTQAYANRVMYITAIPETGDVYTSNSAESPFTTLPLSGTFYNGKFYMLDGDALRVWVSGAFNTTSAIATTWTLKSSLPTAATTMLTASPFYECLVSCGTGGQFYVSTNEGSTWNTPAHTLQGLSASGSITWSAHHNRWYTPYHFTGDFVSASRKLECSTLLSSSINPVLSVNSMPGADYAMVEDSILCAMSSVGVTSTSLDSTSCTQLMFSRASEAMYAFSPTLGSGHARVASAAMNTSEFTVSSLANMSNTCYGFLESTTGVVAGCSNGTARVLAKVNAGLTALVTTTLVNLRTNVSYMCRTPGCIVICYTDSTAQVIYSGNIGDAAVTYTLPSVAVAVALSPSTASIHHSQGISSIDFSTRKITHTQAVQGAYSAVEWCTAWGVFIAYGTLGGVAWSEDGVVFTPGAFYNAPVTVARLRYVPELQLAVACGNGVVAYSTDGKSWRSVSTFASNNWLDIEYNSIAASFSLLGANSPKMWVTDCVFASPVNTWAPGLGYVEKDKVFIGSAAGTPVDEPLTHTLETDLITGDMFSTKYTTSGSCGLFVLGETTSSIPEFEHDATSRGLSIRGSLIKATGSQLNALVRRSLIGVTGGNRYVRLGRRGAISLKRVSATAMSLAPANANMLVVPDASASLVGESRLGSVLAPSVKVGSVTAKGLRRVAYSNPSGVISAQLSSMQYLDDSDWPFHFYYAYGMVYSAKLDMILLIVETSSTNNRNKAAVTSIDGGVTWNMYTTTGLAESSDPSSSFTIERMQWSDAHDAFIVVSSSGLYYSPDGLIWTLSAVSVFGVLQYDSKEQAFSVSSNTSYRILSNSDINALTATYGTTSVGNYIWVPELNKYCGFSGATLHTSTENFPANTFTSHGNYGALIKTMRVVNGKLFIVVGTGTAADTVYYKGDLTAALGTQMATGEAIGNVQALRIKGVELLVVHGASNVFISTGNPSWEVRIPRNNSMHHSAPSVLEGVNSYLTYTGDRFFLLTNTSRRLCATQGVTKSRVLTAQGVSAVYRNRMCGDPLLAANLKGRYMATSSTLLHAYCMASNYSIDQGSMGAPLYVYACDNAFAFAPQPKVMPTVTSMTGAWRFVVWDGARFVSTTPAGSVAHCVANASTMASAWQTHSVNQELSAGADIVSMDSNANGLVAALAVKPSTVLDGASCILYSTAVASGAWTLIASGNMPGDVSWRKLKYVPQTKKWILLGDNAIAHTTSDLLQTNTANAWTVVYARGSWHGVAYGLGKYVFTGDWVSAISIDLSKLVCSMTTRLWNEVIYCGAVSRFYASMVGPTINGMTDYVASSCDGIDWVPNFPDSFNPSLAFGDLRGQGIYWWPGCSQLVIPMSDSNATAKYFAMVSAPLIASNDTTVIATPSAVNLRNGNLEIGNTANAAATSKLHLFTDSAAKPGTNTWFTTSDERVKENIEEVPPSASAAIVKSLPLKSYQWRDEYVQATGASVDSRLGWIAQDVEQVIPSAVQVAGKMYGVDDCRGLDSDQIIAHMWGALRHLIAKVEEKELALAEADGATV